MIVAFDFYRSQDELSDTKICGSRLIYLLKLSRVIWIFGKVTSRFAARKIKT